MRYINHPYWGRLENRTDWYELSEMELVETYGSWDICRLKAGPEAELFVIWAARSES